MKVVGHYIEPCLDGGLWVVEITDDPDVPYLVGLQPRDWLLVAPDGSESYGANARSPEGPPDELIDRVEAALLRSRAVAARWALHDAERASGVW